MALRHRSRFPRTGSGRRQTSWSIGGFESGITVTVAGSRLISTNTQAIVDGLTLVRTHGEILAKLDTCQNAGDGFPRNAYGLCVVSENAAGVGVTAVPSPLTDIDWDGWIAHRMFSLRSTAASGAAASALDGYGGLATAIRMEIDSKAMRKYKLSDVLVSVFEFGSEVGVAQMTIDITLRHLFKIA